MINITSPIAAFQRRQWHPTPVLLPGKSHGWRSLVGCSPWGRWESDTTERLPFHFSLSSIGEGNGNPLQCSCLENPRDGGAGGCYLWGLTDSDMTEVTQQQQQLVFLPGLRSKSLPDSALVRYLFKDFFSGSQSLTSLFHFLPFHFMLFPFLCSLPGSIIIFLTHIYKSLSLYLVFLKWLLSVENVDMNMTGKGMLVLHLPTFRCPIFKKIFTEILRLSLASCVTLSYFTILSIRFLSSVWEQ